VQADLDIATAVVSDDAVPSGDREGPLVLVRVRRGHHGLHLVDARLLELEAIRDLLITQT